MDLRAFKNRAKKAARMVDEERFIQEAMGGWIYLIHSKREELTHSGKSRVDPPYILLSLMVAWDQVVFYFRVARFVLTGLKPNFWS